MNDTRLEEFYEAWSSKAPAEVEYDIEASIRKADIVASAFPNDVLGNIRTILDFGCGYGALVHHLQNKLGIPLALGVDFSASAIEVAHGKYGSDTLRFHRLKTLDIEENMQALGEIAPNGVDCILLIDLLEHVPDCQILVRNLAQFTRYFLIKLPVESSILDNYILPKEYPGPLHSNGHLREFDANNVHYFIRQLGLTPLFEALYVYHLEDIFPPAFRGLSFRQKLIRGVLKNFKGVMAMVLPRKIFLRLVGGGGYFCLATFSEQHVLNP